MPGCRRTRRCCDDAGAPRRRIRRLRHTGRFVAAELLARGWIPVASGRDATKLRALAGDFPGLECRQASIEDPASLDRALAGTVAVINCAGPFLDTAPPLLDTALRARIHYLDMAAEQHAAHSPRSHAMPTRMP